MKVELKTLTNQRNQKLLKALRGVAKIFSEGRRPSPFKALTGLPQGVRERQPPDDNEF